MLYLTGVLRPDMPAMLTPRMRQRPPDGQPWAADNGRFSAPQEYSDVGYLDWLARMPVARALFAVAPDVVADAKATLELSAPMLPRIRALGYPAALAAQDGLEAEPIPWGEFDVLFLGGSTRWKLGEAAAIIVAEAKQRGRWVHMGRVNSRRRMVYAASLGCDSADGTILRFDPTRDVRAWADHVAANPSLWRPS